ncbi:MAG: hypothetical protein LRZ85_05590 [Alphaproteobacteria bacterium]|nr:hypothetical protein [Alphaproteobacteria bacterium]
MPETPPPATPPAEGSGDAGAQKPDDEGSSDDSGEGGDSGGGSDNPMSFFKK